MEPRTLRRPTLRRQAARVALGLVTAALALAAGCARPDTPVSPLSADSPRTNVGTATLGTCRQDIVKYIVDGQNPDEIPVGLCLKVGAVVRIENAPPSATTGPVTVVTCSYEAGVLTCHLNNPGTATIAWGEGPAYQSMTVTVVADSGEAPSASAAPDASPASPPSVTPAPPNAVPNDACLGAVTYTVDGADSADVPVGLCFHVGANLRIENTFPNATAVPASGATCSYEAGIVNCRLVNPGNVTITWGQGATARSTMITVIA